MKRQHY